jgi:hypothetical protein
MQTEHQRPGRLAVCLRTGYSLLGRRATRTTMAASLMEGHVPDRRRLLPPTVLPARHRRRRQMRCPRPALLIVALSLPERPGLDRDAGNPLSFRRGKIFVLVLLGLVAPQWITRITLSSANTTGARAGVPLPAERPTGLDITVVLLLVLGGDSLLDFSEAADVAIRSRRSSSYSTLCSCSRT